MKAREEYEKYVRYLREAIFDWYINFHIRKDYPISKKEKKEGEDLFYKIEYLLEECFCDMVLWKKLDEKQIQVLESILKGRDPSDALYRVGQNIGNS